MEAIGIVYYVICIFLNLLLLYQIDFEEESSIRLYGVGIYLSLMPIFNLIVLIILFHIFFLDIDKN